MLAITTPEFRAYVTKRLADGTPVRQERGREAKDEGSGSNVPRQPVSAGEINRELTSRVVPGWTATMARVLKRMFNLRHPGRQAGAQAALSHAPQDA